MEKLVNKILAIKKFSLKQIIILVAVTLVSLTILMNHLKPDLAGFKMKPFYIENEAQLLIPVPTLTVGEKLTQLWEASFPKIALSYQIIGEDATLGFDDKFDLFYGETTLMAGYYDQLYKLDQAFLRFTNIKAIKHLSQELNTGSPVFVPFDLSGLVLAYNKSILNAIDENLDIIKLNFEAILKLEFSDDADELIALAFNDINSFYGFLTVAGWQPFPLTQETSHNFNHNSFKNSLKFIQELGERQATGNQTMWHYETALIEKNSLLTLVGSWPTHQMLLDDSWQVLEKFPLYSGSRGRQLVNVFGYGINQNSKYKGAAQTFLQFLNTKPVRQALLGIDDFYPVISETWLKELEVDENYRNLLLGLNNGQPTLVHSLKNNPSKAVFEIIEDIKLLEIIEDVYQQKIDVEEAFETINELADQWVKQYDNH